MRVLLDNCIPRRLAALLDGIDVMPAVDIGWAALTDRDLLDAMAGRYDVLVTVDRGIRHQQRLHDRPIAIILLRARTNRLADLAPLIPALRSALGQMSLGKVHEIGGPSVEDSESPVA
jgi:predicted nuclease of predicted toxin-antitoxin system